jgi:hypothetical protein
MPEILTVHWSADLVTACLATLNRIAGPLSRDVTEVVAAIEATGLRTDGDQVAGLLVDLRRDGFVDEVNTARRLWDPLPGEDRTPRWQITAKGRARVSDELIEARQTLANTDVDL